MFRILAFIAVVAIGYSLFSIYGYRYVLDNVRDNAKSEMVMGSLDAPTNIIAYIDYDSPASHQLHATFLNLLSVNSDVSILLRPVAGNTHISQRASRLILAASEQGMFMDLHNILMGNSTQLNESYIEQAVKSLGINYDRLKADAMSPDIEAQVSQVNNELLLLNIETVPFYYIGHIKMDESSDSLKDIRSVVDKLQNGRL